MDLGMGTGRHSNNRPEDIHLAMEQVLNIRWRNSAEERHVVVFTDAPARRGYETRTLAATRTFASDPRNFVSTVQIPHSNLVRQTREILQQIAAAGNGH